MSVAPVLLEKASSMKELQRLKRLKSKTSQRDKKLNLRFRLIANVKGSFSEVVISCFEFNVKQRSQLPTTHFHFKLFDCLGAFDR